MHLSTTITLVAPSYYISDPPWVPSSFDIWKQSIYYSLKDFHLMCITISQSECVVEAQLFFDYAQICLLHQHNSNPNHLEYDNICVRFPLSPLVYLRAVFVLDFVEISLAA